MELPAISDDIRHAVQGRLSTLESENEVTVLFAVESGSRAWGFPSPDSDYDVRFVYVRQSDWYLSINEGRDVIELPIEGDLDINGWDLKKALQLLIKPNPVLLEWLRSPIIYRDDSVTMDQLSRLGRQTAFEKPLMHHYLRVAESKQRQWISGKETVPIKMYFYTLRPVLALRCLRMNPSSPAPMTLSELRAETDLPGEISRFLDEMVAKKAVTRELGSVPRVPALDSLIDEELDLTRRTITSLAATSIRLVEEANRIFRDAVRQNDAGDQAG